MNCKKLRRYICKVFYIFAAIASVHICCSEARLRSRGDGKFHGITNRIRRRPYYDIHRSNKITYCDNPKNARTKACSSIEYILPYQETPYYSRRTKRTKSRSRRRNQRKHRKRNHRDKIKDEKQPKIADTILTPLAGQFSSNYKAEPKLNQFADSFRDWSDEYTNFHLRVFTDDSERRYSVDSSDDRFDVNPKNLVCPKVPNMANVHCSPKYSVDQCWVPDQPDTKCGDGLCCFDGCRNVCFGGIHTGDNSDRDQGSRPHAGGSKR